MEGGSGEPGSPTLPSRETRVSLLELDSGEYFIAASLSLQKVTNLIAIDPTTGALRFSGRSNIDIFESEAEALNFATSGSFGVVKSVVHAKAILGYAPLGTVALLLVATKLRPSVRSLPGGDTVFTVVDSHWVKIPLRNPQPQPKTELRNIQDLHEILINEVHYFCETRDITRPFPSPFPVDSPDGEFVWNEWLSAPFKALGLKQHCVVLLQGLAESRDFFTSSGDQVNVALTARRSRLHPGTRYLARGLNAACSTGNEIECEQLVWPSINSPDQPQPYSSYLWRRGTVPIWWGAEIKSSVTEAEIYVVENQPEGSAKYFERLTTRYGDEQRKVLRKRKGGKNSESEEVESHVKGLEGEELNLSDGDSSEQPLIACVNLLRVGPGKPELVLSESFQESLSKLTYGGQLGGGNVILKTYDWHAQAKLVGEPETVEGLWKTLKKPTGEVGFDYGEFLPDGVFRRNDSQTTLRENSFSEGESITAVKNVGIRGGMFDVHTRQYGVLRFNCADSLDRTNAASFFGAVQVLVEQCRILGFSLEVNSKNVNENSLKGLGGSSPALMGRPVTESLGKFEGKDLGFGGLPPGVLPPGWELRINSSSGRVFYIDHNNRTTSWHHPNPALPHMSPPQRAVSAKYIEERGDDSSTSTSPTQRNRMEKRGKWEYFDLNVRQFKDIMDPVALQGMAEMFLLAGDVHATLYTGSKAMHAHVVQMFSEDAGKAKRASAAANMAITLQRRYLNIVKDSTRQKQLELFLGLRRHKHFPSLPERPLQACPEGYDAVHVRLDLPAISHILVCPEGYDVVELYIFLPEPCQVASLLLTVAHGADDATSARNFDVRVGRHLDDLKVVLELLLDLKKQSAVIPKCAQGTQLLYTFPAEIVHEEKVTFETMKYLDSGHSLYPFEESEASLDFLTRVVAVTFYPNVLNSTMTLGQVEVLGTSLVSDVRRMVSEERKPKEKHAHSDIHFSVSENSMEPKNLKETTQPPPHLPFEDLMDLDWGIPRNLSNSCAVNSPSLIPEFQSLSVGGNCREAGNNFGTQNGDSNGNGNGISHPLHFDETSLEGFPEKNAESSEANGKSPTEVYARMVRRLGPSHKSINFEDALRLDIARVLLKISTKKRNEILRSENWNPNSVDPNRCLGRSEGADVRYLANVLANKTRSIAEDAEMSNLGIDEIEDEDQKPLQRYWKVVNPEGESLSQILGLDQCQGGDCQVRETFRYMPDENSLFSAARNVGKEEEKESKNCPPCNKCSKKVCLVCQAPPGASLLMSEVYSSSSGVGGTGIGEGPLKSLPPSGPLCVRCCPFEVKMATLVDGMRVVGVERRRERMKEASLEAIEELKKYGELEQNGEEPGGEEGRISLAEYPYAGLLFKVPTEEGAESAVSLLAREGEGEAEGESEDSTWQAPRDATSAEVAVVLTGPAEVDKIILQIGKRGYRQGQAPEVRILVGTTCSDKDRKFIGLWNLEEALKERNVNGTNGGKSIRLTYDFPQPWKCRIVWLEFKVPSNLYDPQSSENNFSGSIENTMSRSGSFGSGSRFTNSQNSVKFGGGGGGSLFMDLLSGDYGNVNVPTSNNGNISKAGGGRRGNNSVSGNTEIYNESKIHLRRIRIFGRRTLEDEGIGMIQPQERIDQKRLLDFPPGVSRIKVGVEAERVFSNGRLLEFRLSQVPTVAGFRLDNFFPCRIASQYAASTPLHVKPLQQTVNGNCLDDWLASPSGLTIRVSGKKVLESHPTLIDLFAVPWVRQPTPLYFDFKLFRQVEILIFEVLGEIVPLVEDMQPERMDLDPVSPLSLVNKVRPYRYVPSIEVGAWGQLNLAYI